LVDSAIIASTNLVSNVLK